MTERNALVSKRVHKHHQTTLSIDRSLLRRKTNMYDWLHRDTQPTHKRNKHPTQNRTSHISLLTVKKGLSFLCDIRHHNIVYIFREAWLAWRGALSSNL